MAKIAIVEDDPFTQKFYDILLNKAGHNPSIFVEGDALINFLDSNHTQLIIMDVNLSAAKLFGKPVDGINLSRFLKKSEKYSKIPILIITAQNNAKNLISEEGKNLCDGFLIKPIEQFNKLILKVNELIGIYNDRESS